MFAVSHLLFFSLFHANVKFEIYTFQNYVMLKFENLGKDFESYSFQTLGEACKLPVLNSSPTSFDGVKFSQLAVSNVQAAYKEDFLAFGYRNYPSNDRCF